MMMYISSAISLDENCGLHQLIISKCLFCVNLLIFFFSYSYLIICVDSGSARAIFQDSFHFLHSCCSQNVSLKLCQ